MRKVLFIIYIERIKAWDVNKNQESKQKQIKQPTVRSSFPFDNFFLVAFYVDFLRFVFIAPQLFGIYLFTICFAVFHLLRVCRIAIR